MSGALRYTTDCLSGLRHWRWYDRVGLPELPRLIPACTRAAVLAVPLLAGPSAAVVRVPAPITEYAPGFGADLGWRTPSEPLAGGEVYPASLTVGARDGSTPTAWANPVLRQNVWARLELPQPLPLLLLPYDAPGRQDVPEPAGALVLAVAVVGAVVMRGRGG